MSVRRAAIVALAASLLLVLLPLAMHLHRDDYVIAHDANVPATATKALEQLELLKPQNGGLVQGIVPPISFTTALLYGLPLALGVRPTLVEAAAMTATFAATLFIAILGFGRLLAGVKGTAAATVHLDSCLLGALYIVAPFTLIYVSYGVFWSVNVALAIGVLPWMLHFFIRCFVDERDHLRIETVSALALCTIVVAWSILFVFPALLIGLALLVVRGGLGRRDLAKIAILGVLAGLGSLYSLYGMYVSVIDAGWQVAFDPVTMNAGWGNIQGGILTGFLQYSAWTIYTSWTPRLLLGFPSHFLSLYYVLLTLLLLALSAAFPIVSKQGVARSRYLFAAIVFLVAVFFVKGGDQPFGAVYTSILSTVPGAGLIRTPDTKFGVFIILGIATALAFALASKDKAGVRYRVACRFVIGLIVAYHAVPLIDGRAILGTQSEFAPGESARGYAVHLTDAERHIIAVLNKEPSEGVLVLPTNFGNTRRAGGIFSYRSVIGEFVSNGLYYAAWDEMPSRSIKERLRRAVREGAWWLLPDMHIGFLLVNRNALDAPVTEYGIYHAVKDAPEDWEEVVDLDGYQLYRLRDGLRKPRLVIATDGAEKPLRITTGRDWLAVTQPEKIGSQFTVQFRSAENRHWRLLVMPGNCDGTDYLCLLRTLVSPSYKWAITKLPSPDFLDNRWSVEAKTPPATVALAIVFVPQLVMYALLAVSIATALMCLWLCRDRAAIRGIRSNK